MLSDREIFNPFTQPYLTEGITDPNELLSHYSFQPLQFFRAKLARRSNTFVVGRQGVGKTMLLRLFDAQMVATLYREESPDLKRIRALIPSAAVGVYINLATAEMRIRDFAARGIEPYRWQRAFADFLNCLVLLESIAHLRNLGQIQTWLDASKLDGCPLDDVENVVSPFVGDLRRESKIYARARGLSDIERITQSRLDSWVRFLNFDSASPPPAPLALGVPLFKLVSAVRRIAPDFRLLIIVDQYEALHGHRDVVDMRPVFNQAMYEASRGGTGVEFKIGTRAYSYDNRRLLVGDGRIELGREVDEISLDSVNEAYFRKFAAEMFAKRFQTAVGATPWKRGPTLAANRLPGLSAREEAERYGGNSTSEARHLHPITERWVALGVTEKATNKILDASGLKSAHILSSTLVGIALTRWLRDGAKGAPQGLSLGPKLTSSAGLSEKLIYFGRELLAAVEARYREGVIASRKKGPAQRAADDLVASDEQAALFRIASSYKNQLKYYAGFETLVRVSSNVALVFVQIMKSAYDLMALRGANPLTDVIPVEVQSEAVYAVSDDWERKIASEYDYGVTQHQFVRSLGSSLRKVQIDLTTVVPAANGFSVAPDQLVVTDDAESPRENPVALIHELVSWGVLEERSHQDKTKGQPPRRKFYVNRILCPHFKLSEQHLKDPIYVKDLARFVKELRERRIPAEFANAIASSRGTMRRQANLFQ